MRKLQGRDKLILAFMAAGVMLGTAWAANENPYPNGGTIDLAGIKNEAVYRPEANGSNKLTLTGKEGESASDRSDKNFAIYGASGDVVGDSSLVLDWQAKLYTEGKVQFFAGGDGSNVTGNSSLTVNAADGSIMYAANDDDNKGPHYPVAQQSIILAGSPNGGTVTGNTKLTINGALSGKANFLKASGAAMIDKAGVLTVNGDSTVEINASCEEDCGFGANGGLHIVANGEYKSSGILKGKATLIIDNPNARVEQIWGGNNSVANSSSQTYAATESVAVYLRQGKVGAVTAGPSSWGTNAKAVVSKDVYVEVTSADFGADAEYFSPYLGGGGVSYGRSSSAIVKGNTSVAVKGGGGIDILVGGGLGRVGGNAGVEGNTNIAIIGDAGLKALTKDAWIIAGGKLHEETGNAISTSSAAVSGDATITFANIEKGVFAGKITGQGVQRTVEKKPYDKNEDNDTFNYTTSVAGDSVLVFDNVKADFSGATIMEMDRVEIANGTELTLSNLGAAKELKLTGDWAGKGTVTAVSVKTNGDNIEIDDDEANGIIDYKVTPDASGFKVVVNCSKTEKEKPVKPNLPEESPKDIITAIPGVIYIDVTSADAKKEAVEDVVAAVGGVLKAEDLVVNEETALIEAAESTVVKAAEKALADKGERATVAKVRPLPVFAVESGDITEAGAVVAVGFEMKGSEFLAAKPKDVRLLKVQGSAAGKFFEYTSDPKAFGDGSFTVQDENDAVFAGTFDADTKYKLVLFIKDNGEFDLRSAEREICDPAAIVQTESKASSGSSGGCSAGFAALALIALLPLAMRGKKR